MTIAVVGGGITGLVAARQLARAGRDCVVIERSDRLGGKIQTHHIAGAIVEGGADWFITRTSEARALCDELGLGEDLVPPSVSGAAVWSRGRLRRLPKGFVRGIPTSPVAALRSGLVGPLGAARAVADYVLPGPLQGDDLSVGEYLRTRLGDNVVDRLVDPMLAASRSGAADEMSLRVATPEVDAAARRSRSIMKGLRSVATPAGVAPFLGLRGGMSRMIDALAADLGGVEVRLRTEVRALSATRTGWRLELDDGTLGCSGMILAVPPPIAALLLRDSAHQSATYLSGIRFAPAVVAGLVYEPGAVIPPRDLSGFLVPSRERRFVSAGAWFSAKWPHARAQDGAHVIRCFVGRTEGEERVSLDRPALLERVQADVADIMGIHGAPREARILLQENLALPVFQVGHLETVDRAEAALTGLPPLALAGAGYRGSGIPDCIASGNRAAVSLLD